MRELVHVQGGQCGNQIGAKFWEVRAADRARARGPGSGLGPGAGARGPGTRARGPGPGTGDRGPGLGTGDWGPGQGTGGPLIKTHYFQSWSWLMGVARVHPRRSP